MEKIIQLGEIQLHNDTVREAIMQVERSIGEGSFISIEEVSVNTLLSVDGNEKATKGLEAVTETVFADVEILQALKASDYQRKNEIEHHDFFFELMKRLDRNLKTCYVLGENAETVEEFSKFLQEEFPKLKQVGDGNLAECIGADDALVNEINGLAPDAIISLLPSPLQEVFFLEHKDKFSTLLWYGMGEMNPRITKISLLKKLRRHRLQKVLERHIHGKV